MNTLKKKKILYILSDYKKSQHFLHLMFFIGLSFYEMQFLKKEKKVTFCLIVTKFFFLFF